MSKLVNVASEDCKLILEIESEAFPPDEAADYEGIAFRCNSAPEFFMKWVEGDTIIGYVNGTCCFVDEITHDSMSEHKPEGQTLIIHSVTTAKQYRLKGHATAMLTEYVKVMREKRLVKKILLLAKKHLCPFYEKVGFTTLRESPVVHGKDTWYELGIDL